MNKLEQQKLGLYAPPIYYTATLEERNAIVNGCGAAGAKFDFVPDTIWGLSITPACDIHDWMYHFALPTNAEKVEADRIWMHNMLRLIEHKGGFLKRARRRRALLYFKAVENFGGPAFWADKNKPIEA